MTEPAKTTAVDDDACPGHCGYCDEKHCKWESKVSELETQLRQEREAREKLPADWWTDSSLETWFPITAEIVKRQQAAIGAYEAQVAELKTSLNEQFHSALTLAGTVVKMNAEKTQLQTTVGRQAVALSNLVSAMTRITQDRDYDSAREIAKHALRDAALATCPAPAKEKS